MIVGIISDHLRLWFQDRFAQVVLVRHDGGAILQLALAAEQTQPGGTDQRAAIHAVAGEATLFLSQRSHPAPRESGPLPAGRSTSCPASQASKSPGSTTTTGAYMAEWA